MIFSFNFLYVIMYGTGREKVLKYSIFSWLLSLLPFPVLATILALNSLCNIYGTKKLFQINLHLIDMYK